MEPQDIQSDIKSQEQSLMSNGNRQIIMKILKGSRNR